jgi:hypothetical protein
LQGFLALSIISEYGYKSYQKVGHHIGLHFG